MSLIARWHALTNWVQRVTIDDWRAWRKRYSTWSLAIGAILSTAAAAASMAAPAAALVSIFTIRVVVLIVLGIFVAGFIGGVLKQPKLHDVTSDDDEQDDAHLGI